MKKIISILLCIMFLLGSSATVFAEPVINYKTAIEPYLAIMDKLNLEYGLEGDSRIRLAEGADQNFYLEVQNMSLKEYEQNLRKTYEQVRLIPDEIRMEPKRVQFIEPSQGVTPQGLVYPVTIEATQSDDPFIQIWVRNMIEDNSWGKVFLYNISAGSDPHPSKLYFDAISYTYNFPVSWACEVDYKGYMRQGSVIYPSFKYVYQAFYIF
ncbi:hypothetical protein [Desulfitobacterium hafniense]|uniref:hypothetical protein n=1 Tax=Desulfitobacterium hafniense TaxID=49338 RepID=UPI0003786601|nr:hypothetical protein [Desulfitobacterium hafniense]